jgi:hypothetical protein
MIKFLFTSLVLLSLCCVSRAQNVRILEDQGTQEEATRFCPSAIYFEVLGQGILYSINYDHRLSSHFGFRVGFTKWLIPPSYYFWRDGIIFTGFPFMVNYLSGEGTSHLELGIGVIPAITGNIYEEREVVVLKTATIGYRAQSRSGGFVFRIGLTPFFFFQGPMRVFPSVGLSLGVAF